MEGGGSGSPPGQPEAAEPAAGVGLPSPAPQTINELVGVASRLSVLKNQHDLVVKQLASLRVQQLSLRKQQISALLGLLQARSSASPHTAREAVQSALHLLAGSLSTLNQIIGTLSEDGGARPAQGVKLSALVSEVDRRAEQVSVLAQQMLRLLRAHQDGDGAPPPFAPGATEEEIQQLCRTVNTPGHPASAGAGADGDEAVCPICLCPFSAGDTLCSLACGHLHHQACLAAWLRMVPLCPMCKCGMLEDGQQGGAEGADGGRTVADALVEMTNAAAGVLGSSAGLGDVVGSRGTGLLDYQGSGALANEIARAPPGELADGLVHRVGHGQPVEDQSMNEPSAPCQTAALHEAAGDGRVLEDVACTLMRSMEGPVQEMCVSSTGYEALADAASMHGLAAGSQEGGCTNEVVDECAPHAVAMRARGSLGEASLGGGSMQEAPQGYRGGSS